MKAFLVLFITLWMGTGACLAQDARIDFDKLRLNGLPFKATKAQVVQRLGKPLKIDEPHYECGFLSSQEQGKKMYALHYGYAQFTGNAHDGYLMEKVSFTSKAPQVLQYGSWKLSQKTTVKSLETVFGQPLKAEKTKDGYQQVMIRSKQDDGAIFWFKNGQLMEFTFWSPC
ncbi:hypothetical protein GCM10027511_05380 [Hymenobacter humi]